MSDNIIMILELVLLVGLIALIVIRKRKTCTKKFDEMQLKIRARGYQISFFTALVMMGILAFLLEINALGPVTPGLAAMAALMVSVTVFAVYCITHDAFLAVRSTPKNHYFLYAMIVIVEIVNVVRLLVRGEVIVDGIVDFSAGCAILMAVAFLVILITLIVKTVSERKEAEE